MKFLSVAILITAILFSNQASADKNSLRNKSDSYITYSLSNGQVYRIKAKKGAKPKNISKALDSIAEGNNDNRLNVSPNGKWLVLNSERFEPDCIGWACLSIVDSKVKSGNAVKVNGDVIHTDGFNVVASSGNLIIYSGDSGPHTRDLWAVSRKSSKSRWKTPVLLTEDSPYDFNTQPAISNDGEKVVFDGGDGPYGAPGTSICEVSTDGSDFKVVITPDDIPAGYVDSGDNALHHPDYVSDGSIIFESSWNGQQIWKLSPGSEEPVLISVDFPNDNSPCVLNDGRITSLWVDRNGGYSFHEIKVMNPDGSHYKMVLKNIDIFDIGIGCGK
ncbi:MAG: hypothetical protein HZA77_06915 [Candidatus Schekmanbacteria bacterium]|nr:hypothetical protein [Candidatus Schekmanbacteria bacterium]